MAPSSGTRRGSRSRWPADYERFRTRLVQARHARDLTQRDVAKSLSVPPSFVAKCENGERRVDVVELRQFARLYRKRITYFFPED